MDIFQYFPKDSVEYKQLEKFAQEYHKATGLPTKVGYTWFDFDAGIKWTTVISTDHSGHVYQMLDPWEVRQIIEYDNWKGTLDKFLEKYNQK